MFVLKVLKVEFLIVASSFSSASDRRAMQNNATMHCGSHIFGQTLGQLWWRRANLESCRLEPEEGRRRLLNRWHV